MRSLLSGLTKFLVLDIRKPDYSLIKQQLESTYASASASAAATTTTSQTDGNFLDNNLMSEQQWTLRVFGKLVFLLLPLLLSLVIIIT